DRRRSGDRAYLIEQLQTQALPVKASARQQGDNDQGESDHPGDGKRVCPDITASEPLEDDGEGQHEGVGERRKGKPPASSEVRAPGFRPRRCNGRDGRRVRGWV